MCAKRPEVEGDLFTFSRAKVNYERSYNFTPIRLPVVHESQHDVYGEKKFPNTGVSKNKM